MTKQQARQYFLSLRKHFFYNTNPYYWGHWHFVELLKILGVSSTSQFMDQYEIAFYFPIRYEISLLSFAQKTWILPKIQKNRSMEWFYYGDGVSNYVKNSYGFLEKAESFPFPKFQKTCLCFVPALAVHPKGYRLGYGGGYYDVFLKSHQSRSLITICCVPNQKFVCNSISYDSWDIPVDIILFPPSYKD